MSYSKLSLPLFLFFAIFIRLNAQADAFFKFDFDFSNHDYSECAAIMIDGDVLVDDYSPNGKCILKQNDEGMISLSTVSLTDIATTPRDAIKFQVAIKNKKTNTLFLLTKEAVLEIDLKYVLEQCKLGDSIIILTDNQRYSLTHHEIEILWKC